MNACPYNIGRCSNFPVRRGRIISSPTRRWNRFLVGDGGLAAARSIRVLTAARGLSFITLMPLRYPDGPL